MEKINRKYNRKRIIYVYNKPYKWYVKDSKNGKMLTVESKRYPEKRYKIFLGKTKSVTPRTVALNIMRLVGGKVS